MQTGAKASELLKRVVIGPRVMEVLVGVLLGVFILWWMSPALTWTTGGNQGRVARVKVEMTAIQTAILAYVTEYGMPPMSAETSRNQQGDFTFGTAGTGCGILVQNPGDGRQANNSEVMAILMDRTTFRNGQATANTHHVLNPKRIEFLTARQAKGNQHRGLGEDGVYRDPWGNPYIITLDLNGDGFCDDPLYGKVRQKVFVWSFGPDVRADLGAKPNDGVNADNVTTAP